MRGEVYARLTLTALVRLARTSGQMLGETKARIPTLPLAWRSIWTRLSTREPYHRRSARRAVLDLMAAGLPSWPGVYRAAGVLIGGSRTHTATEGGITWYWIHAMNATAWELVWKHRDQHWIVRSIGNTTVFHDSPRASFQELKAETREQLHAFITMSPRLDFGLSL